MEENNNNENIENDNKILSAENKTVLSSEDPKEKKRDEMQEEKEEEKKSIVFFPEYSFKQVYKHRKFKDEEDLINAISEYFEIYSGVTVLKDGKGNELRDKFGGVITHTKPPTVAGLCLHLGFLDRASIYDYVSRNDPHSNIIKTALLTIEQFAESMLYTGKPVGAIFWLKNHKWTDKQEIDVSNKTFESFLKDYYGENTGQITEGEEIN